MMQLGSMIDRAVETAARSHAEDLEKGLANDWWPAPGDNDAAEANIGHHLSVAFAGEGFRPYFEAARPAKTDGRIDLVLVNWDEKTCILCEIKNLYGASTQGLLLLADAERLGDVALSTIQEKDEKALGFDTTYLVVGSCWRKPVADWWKTGVGADRLRKNGRENWQHVRKGLLNLEATLEVVIGAADSREKRKGFEQQFLLYGYWPKT